MSCITLVDIIYLEYRVLMEMDGPMPSNEYTKSY